MRRNLLKLVLVPVTAIILMLIAAPAMVAAPDMMSGDCASAPHPEETSVPICCLTADCLFVNCGLSNTDNKAILTGRYLPNNSVGVTRSQTDTSSEASPDLKKPPLRDPTSELPSPLDNEHRCRNCLSSEEPSQV